MSAPRRIPESRTNPTTAPSSPVRLSAPGDVVAAVPLLCGFTPQESLVAISLHPPRQRVGLTLRVDLPDPAIPADERACLRMVAARLVEDGARSAVVVVLSSDGRREPLVEQLTRVLDEAGVEVLEALHVEDERWTSYQCERDCCPPSGTPLATEPTGPLSRLTAQSVLSGRRVLASREELAACVAPPVLLAERAGREEMARALVRRLEAPYLTGLDQRAADLALASEALDRVADGGALDLASACDLAVSLTEDRTLRDEIGTWALDRDDDLQAMLQQAAVLVPSGADAAVCALLGMVAYARGEGALAGIALDRALASDPEHALAGLLMQMLEVGLPPREVRALLRDTRQVLVSPAGSRAGRPARPAVRARPRRARRRR